MRTKAPASVAYEEHSLAYDNRVDTDRSQKLNRDCFESEWTVQSSYPSSHHFEWTMQDRQCLVVEAGVERLLSISAKRNEGVSALGMEFVVTLDTSYLYRRFRQ